MITKLLSIIGKNEIGDYMSKKSIGDYEIDYSKDSPVVWQMLIKEEDENPKPVFMKPVSKEEFEKFISEYPNKLEVDYYMDWYSYNDFSLNGGCVWPESMVAMKSDGSYDQPIKYKILFGEYLKMKNENEA